MSVFALHVECELKKARLKHAPINSLHEGYAVILEEVDELWEHVRARKEKRNKTDIYKELVQIAAMAQRTAEDVVEDRG
jgi:hypothetical protein